MPEPPHHLGHTSLPQASPAAAVTHTWQLVWKVRNGTSLEPLPDMELKMAEPSQYCPQGRHSWVWWHLLKGQVLDINKVQTLPP